MKRKEVTPTNQPINLSQATIGDKFITGYGEEATLLGPNTKADPDKYPWLLLVGELYSSFTNKGIYSSFTNEGIYCRNQPNSSANLVNKLEEPKDSSTLPIPVASDWVKMAMEIAALRDKLLSGTNRDYGHSSHATTLTMLTDTWIDTICGLNDLQKQCVAHGAHGAHGAHQTVSLRVRDPEWADAHDGLCSVCAPGMGRCSRKE